MKQLTRRIVPILHALALSASSPRAQASGEPYIERELVFNSGMTALHATLLLPESNKKPPGVVLIHGSGESDRTNPWTKAYAEALAKRGVAVLHPDKRGCGKSGGDWRSASLLDFADDALAAMDALRKEGCIDEERLGLMGFSQGGHVLPVAVSRDPQVRFAIDISGSVVPMAEQIADEVEMSAERAGLTKAQLRLVVALNEKGLRFVQSGLESDWADYERSLSKAKEGELKGSAVIERFPASRDQPALAHLRTILNHDPMEYWKRVTVPALFVFGGNDTQIRVDKSLRRLQAELRPNGCDYSVLLFSRNGHALYREDLCDFIAGWIRDGGKS